MRRWHTEDRDYPRHSEKSTQIDQECVIHNGQKSFSTRNILARSGLILLCRVLRWVLCWVLRRVLNRVLHTIACTWDLWLGKRELGLGHLCTLRLLLSLEMLL